MGGGGSVGEPARGCRDWCGWVCVTEHSAWVSVTYLPTYHLSIVCQKDGSYFGSHRHHGSLQSYPFHRAGDCRGPTLSLRPPPFLIYGAATVRFAGALLIGINTSADWLTFPVKQQKLGFRVRGGREGAGKVKSSSEDRIDSPPPPIDYCNKKFYIDVDNSISTVMLFSFKDLYILFFSS